MRFVITGWNHICLYDVLIYSLTPVITFLPQNGGGRAGGGGGFCDDSMILFTSF